MSSAYRRLQVHNDEDDDDGTGDDAIALPGDAGAGGAAALSNVDGDDDAPATLDLSDNNNNNNNNNEAGIQTTGKPKRLSLRERLKRRRENMAAKTAANAQQTAEAPAEPPRELTDEERALEEDEFKEELRYYMAQVVQLIAPIVATFAFTVWFTRCLFDSDITAISPFAPYQESVDDDGWSRFGGAVLNALMLVGLILVTTFIFVCLFYFRLTKILYVWLGMSVVMTLGGLGGTIIYYMCQSYNITVDFLSLAIFLWNFGAVGILSIMWQSPLYIQQAYLILISALIATDFTLMPEWTSWAFLAAISLYDLAAVLCPGGPLNMLVNLSRQRNERIPALLYSAGMADNSRSTRGTMLAYSTGDDRSGLLASTPLDDDEDEGPQYHSKPKHTSNDDAEAGVMDPSVFAAYRSEAGAGGDGEGIPMVELNGEGQATGTDVAPAAEEEEPPSSVQLGLGDFIFYSVLVARASLASWLTLVACALATLMGLCLTLLLLATYRRALPALPISIGLGMIFFFGCNGVIVPFATQLASQGIVI